MELAVACGIPRGVDGQHELMAELYVQCNGILNV